MTTDHRAASAKAAPSPQTADLTRPRRALLSTSDKSGLEPLAAALTAVGCELISTGGTAAALSAAGFAVTDVASVTGAPEMLGGRVKTLHPAIHGGVLARRDDPEHMATLAERGLGPIDLVAVNLYPFERTVASGADFEACVEQIDIGGPAMIRAAAKNLESVVVLCDPSDYADVAEVLAREGGVPAAIRRRLAAKAFQRTAAYDAAIAEWMAREAGETFPERLTVAAERRAILRYGENPHQAAAFYATDGAEGFGAAARATLLSGKALSYNNIADADAALELALELDRFDKPAVVIVKHANPCGVAIADDMRAAYERARACDPTSAFGGVVAANRLIDAETALTISEIFTEVVVAPGFTDEARAILSRKSALRLLQSGEKSQFAPWRRLVAVRGGLLAQTADLAADTFAEARVVTRRAPTEAERADLAFAWAVAKHVKSNAIVYAKNGATVGVGAGQMSRVDSTRIAARKASEMVEPNQPSAAVGSVVASDAFFPFADGLLTAAEAGATAVVQPGGSIRDQEVIDAADEAGLAMMVTGVRHFRH